MHLFTSKEVVRDLDSILEMVESDPVFIRDGENIAAVMISPAALRNLQGRPQGKAAQGVVEAAHEQSIKRFGALYRALAEYEKREQGQN